MATVYQIMAASMRLSSFNTAPIMEQVNNWVLTSQGKDCRGVSRVAKYVNCGLAAPVGVPVVGAAYVAAGITDPVGCEKVSQIALKESSVPLIL